MSANLGPKFYPKLVEMATELGMKPEDLINIMISESGLNPAAHNPHGGASGLIQFMPFVLKGLGFPGTAEDFRKLSGEEQLPWVKKLIKSNMSIQGGKPFVSAGHFYVSNLWPVALKLPGVQKGDLNTVIIEKNPETVTVDSAKGPITYSKKYYDVGSHVSPKSEIAAYNGNPLFDRSKKGNITLGDLERQTQVNSRNSTYNGAVSTMEKETGYKPKSKGVSIMPPKENSRGPQHFMDIVDQYAKLLAASEKSLKRLYKTALVNHDIVIAITASDYTSAVEFSRILCNALDEDLLSSSYTYTDGQKIEVECSIPGPADECFAAVKQMTEAVAETFKDATVKIGGITIQTKCFMNKKSSYQPISLRSAGSNYRTFLLKFV